MPVVSKRRGERQRIKHLYGPLAKVKPWRCPRCGAKTALPGCGELTELLVCLMCAMAKVKRNSTKTKEVKNVTTIA